MKERNHTFLLFFICLTVPQVCSVRYMCPSSLAGFFSLQIVKVIKKFFNILLPVAWYRRLQVGL